MLRIAIGRRFVPLKGLQQESGGIVGTSGMDEGHRTSRRGRCNGQLKMERKMVTAIGDRWKAFMSFKKGCRYRSRLPAWSKPLAFGR